MFTGEKNTIILVTPEGVEFSLVLAGTITRFIAWMIDFFVIITASIFLSKFFLLVEYINLDLAQALNIIFYFLISIGYGIAAEWYWRGQTIGKRLLSLRVIDKNAGKINFHQIFIRNLLRVIDMLPALYLIGGLFNFFTKNGQRLGDIAADTIVIRHSSVSIPDIMQLNSGKYNIFRKFPKFEMRIRQKLQPLQTDLAIQCILRRDSLEPESRILIYKQAADHFDLLLKTPLELKVNLTDEQFLRNIIDSYYKK